MYGVRTASRSDFFIFTISQTGYPPVGKVTDYYGADIRRYKIHGLVQSGYPPLNMSRSGADFFECVTERISTCGESHGLSRSGYPSLQISRIIAKRISVALFISRSGLSHSVEQTAQNRGISPQCTVSIIR